MKRRVCLCASLIALVTCLTSCRVFHRNVLASTPTPLGTIAPGQTLQQSFEPAVEGEAVQSSDGEAVHAFDFRASVGDYIQVFLEQQGLDVILAIYGPAGERIRAGSSRERRFGPELGYTIAEADGVYQVRVWPDRRDSAIGPNTGVGTYAVTLEIVRPANDQDRERLDEEQPLYDLTNRIFAVAGSGDWTLASELFDEWLQRARIFEPRDGKQRDVAVGVVSLSRALWNSNTDRDLAEEMLLDGIGYMSRTQGENAFLTVSLRSFLGSLYIVSGRPDAGWSLVRSALEVMESTPDTEPMDYSQALGAAGQYYRQMNDLSTASDYFERSLEIQLRELRTDLEATDFRNQAIFQTQFSLGNIYRLMGDNESARPLLESATSRNGLRFLSPNAMVDRLAVMSVFWFDLGEYDRVQEVVDRALRIHAASPVSVNLIEGLLRRSAAAYRALAEEADRRALEIRNEGAPN